MLQKCFSLVCILIAIFCFWYCYIVFRIKSGGYFFLIWSFLGLFFIGLSAVIRFGWWQGFPLALRRSIVILFAVGLVLFLLVEGLIVSRYREKGEPGLSYIIVLGAQMKPHGPSAVLKFRLDKAYEYLCANENTVCIVSGGQGSNEPCTEAQGMYDYLVERGISGDRILQEDQSTSTSENIRFSAKIIGDYDASVGIVTNNFHVFRSVMLAKHEGFTKVCGIAARSNVYFQLNNMFREFFGVVKDAVMCGIDKI